MGEPARRGPDTLPSLFAQLRRRHPDLAPARVEKRHLVPLSQAIEEESAARAEPSLLIGSFQRERFYRQNERRWRELSLGAGQAFVFADFPRLREPASAPVEIPIGRDEPLSREWGLVCLAPGHGACLVAWEPPAQGPRRDGERRFELLFSVEPAVVHQAAAGAADLAAEKAPQVAAACRERLAGTIDADPASQLRFAAAITARFIARLAPGG